MIKQPRNWGWGKSKIASDDLFRDIPQLTRVACVLRGLMVDGGGTESRSIASPGPPLLQHGESFVKVSKHMCMSGPFPSELLLAVTGAVPRAQVLHAETGHG